MRELRGTFINALLSEGRRVYGNRVRRPIRPQHHDPENRSPAAPAVMPKHPHRLNSHRDADARTFMKDRGHTVRAATCYGRSRDYWSAALAVERYHSALLYWACGLLIT